MIVSNTRSDGSLAAGPVPETGAIDLQPGDWVEVRPFEEIASTLDGEQKHGGLLFMPEMKQFCGQRFRVFKRVRTIKLESTGEVRTMKAPPVLLEGVYCDGAFHEGCDRACLHFWRDAWLQRVPPPGRSTAPAGT